MKSWLLKNVCIECVPDFRKDKCFEFINVCVSSINWALPQSNDAIIWRLEPPLFNLFSSCNYWYSAYVRFVQFSTLTSQRNTMLGVFYTSPSNWGFLTLLSRVQFIWLFCVWGFSQLLKLSSESSDVHNIAGTVILGAVVGLCMYGFH